jgi:integrase
MASFRRETLQLYLDEKTRSSKLSYAVVNHLRWDLRAIFRLAFQDGVIPNNPAEQLFVAGAPNIAREVLTAEQVQMVIGALDLREQLVVRLAVFSGMRPGEILALQWKHVYDDHVLVEQRVYKGHIDTPKTARSKRQVALSPNTVGALKEWKRICPTFGDLNGWVFPSENNKTPILTDNIWRRVMEPRLEKIILDWATFQVMRRTHASLSRQAGIDPKLVADQLGHGLGVNLDVYTIAGLDQRLKAVNTLEQSLASSVVN